MISEIIDRCLVISIPLCKTLRLHKKLLEKEAEEQFAFFVSKKDHHE